MNILNKIKTFFNKQEVEQPTNKALVITDTIDENSTADQVPSALATYTALSEMAQQLNKIIETILTEGEYKRNRAEFIDKNSTHDKYATAKAVYDAIEAYNNKVGD